MTAGRRKKKPSCAPVPFAKCATQNAKTQVGKFQSNLSNHVDSAKDEESIRQKKWKPHSSPFPRPKTNNAHAFHCSYARTFDMPNHRTNYFPNPCKISSPISSAHGPPFGACLHFLNPLTLAFTTINRPVPRGS